MLALNIEVTSGLHAGAKWKFNHGIVTLGGNANSEVFLCDDGIPDQCLKLRVHGNRITFEEISSDVRFLGQAGKTPSRVIYAGQSMTITCRQVQFTITANSESGLLWSKFANNGARFFGGALELVRSIGPGTVMAISCLFGLMATTVILFFGSANFSESQAFPAANLIENPKAIPPPPAPPVADQLLRVVQLQLLQFKGEQKLSDFDVNIEYEKVRVSARGSMSRMQLQIFESLIKRISSDHGRQIEIIATLSLTDEQKAVDDIEVAGVLLGAQPALMLRDGTRLFVGASYQGVVLDQVSESGLVFVGSTRYELPL
jgi:hypothetical protein